MGAFDSVVSANISGGYKPTPTSPPPTPTFKPPVTKTSQSFLGNVWSGLKNFGTSIGNSKLGQAFSFVIHAPEWAVATGDKYMVNAGEKLPSTTPWAQKVSTKAQAYGTGFLKGITGQEKTMYGTGPEEFNKAQFLGIQNPTAQSAYNLGLGLALPTGFDLGVGRAINKVGGEAFKLAAPVLKPLSEGVSKFVKETPELSKIVEAFNPAFKVPEVSKIMSEADDAARIRINKLYRNISEDIKGLSTAQRERIGQLMQGGVSVSTKEKPLLEIAKKYNDLADKIGEEGVAVWNKTGGRMGLNPQSFEKFKGQYLTHIWDTAKKTPGADLRFISQAPSVAGQFWKKRKGAQGYILDFAPAAFKGLGQEMVDIAHSNAYLQVAEKYGVDLSKLPSVEEAAKVMEKNFGYAASDIKKMNIKKFFTDMALPKDVIDYINKYQMVPAKNIFTQYFDAALNVWKKGKTIWNPAYHVRNLISNQILTDMATGRGLANTVIDYIGAVANYFSGKDDFVKAAEDVNLIRAKSFTQAFEDFKGAADLVEKKGIFSKFDDFMKGFQNVSEETAKLNVFTAKVEEKAAKMGITAEEALKNSSVLKFAKDASEEAIFSPYRIGAGERALVQRFFPFYSFTRQALPFTIKTAVQHPERLAKYSRIKASVEAQKREGIVPDSQIPEWQRGGIQLPANPLTGKNASLDTTYIYPWGNFTDTSNGLPFGLSFNPAAEEYFAQKLNRDAYFNKDIATSSLPGISLRDTFSLKPKQAGSQRAAHLLRTALPSAYSTIQGKLAPAIAGVPDYAGRNRSVPMAILDAAGIKLSVLRPEDQKKFAQYDKRALLKQIQKEMFAIQNDKTLSPQDKQYWLSQYRLRYQEAARTGK